MKACINNLIPTILSFASSLLLTCSVNSMAETYQIEMTVLGHDDAAAKREQTWPITSVSYPQQQLALLTDSNNTIDKVDLVSKDATIPLTLVPLLDSSNYQHQELIATLLKKGQRSILFHQAWLLALDKKADAQNIIIQGGKTRSNVSELGGTVRFYTAPAPDNLPPIIHITTALWRVEFATTENNTVIDWSVPQRFPDVLSSLLSNHNIHINNINSIATITGDEVVNRNKLHYIDGPRFSVLLEIRTLVTD